MSASARRRFRLPLFPLPVVLFPGTSMPLHIFEPRYRRMVDRCLAGDRRFGLLYHDPDDSGPFLTEPGRVGCVAEIRTVQRLPDGRSLLVTHGIGRFVVQDGLESSEPYYEAVVSPYDDVAPGSEIRERRSASARLFGQLIIILSDGEEEPPDLDPSRELSFLLAGALRIEPAWQQSLLELRAERERLDRLDAVLRAALE